jgi:hypothetical protein
MSLLGLKKLLTSNSNLFKCSFSTINKSSNKSRSSSSSSSSSGSLSTDRQNELVIEYLRSTKIKYCQGWSTFNLYVCPKAEESFHLNKNTGYLNYFEFV